MLGTRTGQSITVTLLSGYWPHLYPPTHTVWDKKPASDIPLILAGQPGDSVEIKPHAAGPLWDQPHSKARNSQFGQPGELN